MKTRKTLFLSILVVVILCALCSCTNVKQVKKSGRISGDGSTPLKAIILNPTDKAQSSGKHLVTVQNNDRWFFVSVPSGRKLIVETAGQGDPSLRIYKSTQLSKGVISGDPVAFDNDSAPGENARLSIGPGNYYIRITLYAGQKWVGDLVHRLT